MSVVRQRRLQADYERLLQLVSAHRHPAILTIESVQGNPPEKYVLVFRGPTLAELRGTLPVYCERQRLKIEMPADYPAISPLVTVFGTIFHPHVWPKNNVVCLGSWNISESLDRLALRLSSLLRYDPEQLNWRSVANFEAAEWARRNQHLFPLGQAKTQAKTPSTSRWYETA
jgi:ubiquitin-protein ligase